MWILLLVLLQHLQFLSLFFTLLAGDQPLADTMCICNTVWTSAEASLVFYRFTYTCNYSHYNLLLANNCFIEQLKDKRSLRKKSSKYVSSSQFCYHVHCRYQTFQHLHWEGDVQDDPSVLHLGIKWQIWERNNTVLQL